MAKRVTHEQLELIIRHLQDGVDGREVAKWIGVHVNTVQKIHAHASRVGHYKTVTLTKPLPEWKCTAASKRNKPGEVHSAVKLALVHFGSATISEIHDFVGNYGIVTSRQTLYSVLARLAGKGLVHYSGSPYVYTSVSTPEESLQ